MIYDINPVPVPNMDDVIGTDVVIRMMTSTRYNGKRFCVDSVISRGFLESRKSKAHFLRNCRKVLRHMLQDELRTK